MRLVRQRRVARDAGADTAERRTGCPQAPSSESVRFDLLRAGDGRDPVMARPREVLDRGRGEAGIDEVPDCDPGDRHVLVREVPVDGRPTRRAEAVVDPDASHRGDAVDLQTVEGLRLTGDRDDLVGGELGPDSHDAPGALLTEVAVADHDGQGFALDGEVESPTGALRGSGR